MTVDRGTAAIALALWVGVAGAAGGQTTVQMPLPPQAQEEIEARSIGTTGTILVGLSGYLDKVYSSERVLPTNYTLQVEIGRFVRPKIVVRGGLSGSGSYGGDDPEDRPSGIGAPALHAHLGAFYYVTPQAMWSLYAGAEYWTQLTQRAASDRGSLMGALGVQGAVSSRVSLFAEGAYGLGLTGPDESTNRLTARVGVRLKY